MMFHPSVSRFALIFLAFLSTGVGASDDLSWQPDLGIRYRNISDTAISPDGSMVAWVVQTALVEGEKSEYLNHIWLADSAAPLPGGRQFTRGDQSCSAPAFSPDGKWLAFLSARGTKAGGESRGEPGDEANKTQLWRIPLFGGEAEQLTTTDSGVTSFKWSPTGSQLAYLSPDPQSDEEKSAKKEKRDVILVDQNFKFSHLYTIPAEPISGDERSATRLTEGDFHVTSIDWSPDGQRIAFAFSPDPRINTTGTEQDLAWVPSKGGDLRPLVTRPGVDGTPLYSPDGTRIAFTSHGGQVERVGLSDLWVLPADGGTPRELAYTPNRQSDLVAWTSDGSTLLATDSHGTTRGAIRIGVDSGKVSLLQPTNADLMAVSTSPTFDRETQTVAWVQQGSERPPEVYATRLDAPEPRQLSSVNGNLPRPPMGRTELLSWRSPDGRFEIEGLLTYPIGFQPGDRPPLILNVHGGPSGVFSQTFTGAASIYQIQYFAQLGYAVLRPNPRGSTGYGKDFRYANIRDWGFGDMDDLMAGVDHVIDLGIGDPDRLFLMGWSYGGYMTSFAVTRTDRFKAASMGAGLPNLVSMVTTTDIPDYLAAHMGGEPWDDYETYEKHSAMYRIGNVVTPTQVIHGQNDLRVPFTQGQEFYVALQRRGIPTEMVVYPRTPHGPREPKLLMDVSPRIAAWFARFGGQPLPAPAEETAQATAGSQ